MLIPYSSNTFWKFGIFIFVTFASANNAILPPFLIYFNIASLSTVFKSSFNVVKTSTSQSSGILPFVNISNSSTSFASDWTALLKDVIYVSKFVLFPVKKYTFGLFSVVTSRRAFVIASSVKSFSSYVL